jgi:hypothetical protein
MASVDACPHCAGRIGRLSVQPLKDGREHLRLECAGCGRYIKFVSRTVENVKAAIRREDVDLSRVHQ